MAVLPQLHQHCLLTAHVTWYVRGQNHYVDRTMQGSWPLRIEGLGSTLEVHPLSTQGHLQVTRARISVSIPISAQFCV